MKDLGIALATGIGAAGMLLATTAWAAPDFSGVWGIGRQYATGMPPATTDGKPPPISPAAQAERQYLDNREKAGLQVIHNTMMGWPKGFIQASRDREPFEIFQDPKQMSFFFEEDNQFDFIYIDAKHRANPKPSFLGDSVAHWEGDTLVVDTIATNGEIPLNNIQVSAQAHFTMRLRLVNDGKSLENIVTIDDPVDFTRTWQMKIVYNRLPAGSHLSESVYAENNRDLPDLAAAQ
jgi:hypothetical protein